MGAACAAAADRTAAIAGSVLMMGILFRTERTGLVVQEEEEEEEEGGGGGLQVRFSISSYKRASRSLFSLAERSELLHIARYAASSGDPISMRRARLLFDSCRSTTNGAALGGSVERATLERGAATTADTAAAALIEGVLLRAERTGLLSTAVPFTF